MISVPSQGSSEKYAEKQRNNVNTDVVANQQRQSRHHSSEKQRFDWLKKECKYAILPNQDIIAQNELLHKQIVTLNEKYKQLLQEVRPNMSNLTHSRMNSHGKQEKLRARDMENNAVIIASLMEDLDLLIKREKAVESKGELSLAELKQRVLDERNRVKALKLKSKAIGDKLENDQDVFVELKQWERDRDSLLTRKNKLYDKLKKTEANEQRLNQKLAEIDLNYDVVEQYLKQWAIHREEAVQKESLEHLYHQKQYQLEVANRMVESQKNSKTQKYHQKLKKLQAEVEKAELFDQKTNNMEIHVLKQQKEIYELTEKLQDLQDKLQQERSHTTEEPVRFIEGERTLEKRDSQRTNPYHLEKIKNIRNHSKEAEYPRSGRSQARKKFYSKLRDKLEAFDDQHPNISFSKKMPRNVQLQQIKINKTDIHHSSEQQQNLTMLTQIPSVNMDQNIKRGYMRISRQLKTASRKSSRDAQQEEAAQIKQQQKTPINVYPKEDKIQETGSNVKIESNNNTTTQKNNELKVLEKHETKESTSPLTENHENTDIKDEKSEQDPLAEQVHEQGQVVEQKVKEEEQLKRKQEVIASYIDNIEESADS